jgi:hypothetical protein
MVIFLIITQYILFVISMLLLVNYFAVHLPFVEYPSLTDTAYRTPHYLRNILLYLLFWVQHIVMATLKYKIVWATCCSYFLLYDRYIYNITSAVCLWVMCALL